MSEDRPDECQYYRCHDSPDGGLEFFFGERWFCGKHYAQMSMDFDGDITVIEDPSFETASLPEADDD